MALFQSLKFEELIELEHLVWSVQMLPDLAKFRQFGKILKVIDNFLRVCLLFGKFLNRFWQKLCYFVILILVNGQILKKIL